MNTRYLYTLAALVAAAAVVLGYQKAAPRSQKEDRDAAAVRAVLDAQAAAWNRGDVEGYMEGYAKEDTTTFVSGDTVTRGWRTVLERYKARYDTREKMGSLSFTELEIKPLSEFYFMATGRWQLTLADGATPHGRFTLIFRRTNAGWRIVHDHTSSA
ncbi:MAG TPA: nuclear transport factor 2 family protein [Pyrinomonadaceae bacterium]|jgi:ketosteroid isomerase-like protein|nr:nuclear transport factor 2 family protein [Pyrinomonadaceae bacterium]